jgi:hypothetical protein
MAVHEDLPDLDIQDFRLWWERGAPSEATHGRLRVWKVIATMLMFVALTSIVVLAIRASYPRPLKGLTDVSPVGVPAAGGSRQRDADGNRRRYSARQKELAVDADRQESASRGQDAGVARFAD